MADEANTANPQVMNTYNVGPLTMKHVFAASGLTNVSDWQAVLAAMENALAAVREDCAHLADRFSASAYDEGLSEDVVMARGYMASDIATAIRERQA